MKGKNLKNTAMEFVMITLATVLLSLSVYFFLTPSHLTPGSVAGLAIILTNVIPLPMSAISMILNVALLIVGFLFVGREFGAKTVYTSILMPAILAVLERAFPNNVSLTQDALADMLCFLFICSFGQSILFKCNASSGGLDIVGKLLNKYLHMEMGHAISLVGMCIALSSALVYDAKTVALSVLATYLSGIVLDHFIFNANMKKRVCIISNQREKVIHYITSELHSGATLYEAKGAFTDEVKTEIITIVNMHEYRKLMDFISETDPEAFVTIYNVSEAVYRPKGST